MVHVPPEQYAKDPCKHILLYQLYSGLMWFDYALSLC